jgi:4-hydroxy-tetrahydrodipicolinate synthase
VALQLKGVFVPNITPFSDNAIDETALRRVLDYLLDSEIDGLVPCGTTGESATLTHDEHRRVVELTIQHAAGRASVIAGAGSNSTAEAIELVEHAEGAGADAALVICPYYNRPTQAGLIEHFTRVAESTSLPLIMYNVPSRTGVNMAAATTVRLAQVPNIVGVKEASGDLDQIGDIIRLAPPDFAVLSGDGGILADAHVLPNEWRRMVNLIAAGNIAEAREIHYRLIPITNALFMESNPAPAKAALDIMGICSPEMRLPLLPATDPCRAVLREELSKLGII